MPEPYVGLPSDAIGCAFSAELDSAACHRFPDLHLCVDSSAWGIVALSSCADHAPIARATGAVLAEHEYGPDCVDGGCFG